MIQTSIWDDKRVVSEIYGTVLIISISFLTALLIIALGGAVIGGLVPDTEDRVTQDSILEMDDRLNSISASEVGSTTSFNYPLFAEETLSVDPEHGTVHISAEATVDEEYLLYRDKHTTSTELSLGTIQYVTNDGTTVAYQGGAVIQQHNQEIMLSSPEFDYDGYSVTIGFTDISALQDISAGEEIRATNLIADSQTRSAEVRDLIEQSGVIGSDGKAHGIAPVDLTFTIETEFVNAWESYLTEDLTQPINAENISTSEESLTMQLTVGDNFELASEDEDFDYGNPQIRYAGVTQFAQYSEHLEPVDGGPAFVKGEGFSGESDSIVVYHTVLDEWVYFDEKASEWASTTAPNSSFDSTNESHVDDIPANTGDIAPGVLEWEGDEYKYQFENDALVCIADAENLQAGPQSAACSDALVKSADQLMNPQESSAIFELVPVESDINIITFE